MMSEGDKEDLVVRIAGEIYIRLVVAEVGPQDPKEPDQSSETYWPRLAQEALRRAETFAEAVEARQEKPQSERPADPFQPADPIVNRKGQSWAQPSVNSGLGGKAHQSPRRSRANTPRSKHQ